MNIRLLILNLALALGGFAALGTVAHAAILIEPFAGYQIGKFKQANHADADYKMTTYGGRLGVQRMGFMGGAEYLTGAGTEDAGSPPAKLTPTNLGVFVGYTFPVLLRIYGVYSFDAKIDRKVDVVSTTYAGGTSMKLGLGITSLAFLAINIEYVTGTYTKINAATLKDNITSGSYGISLSFPLTL